MSGDRRVGILTLSAGLAVGFPPASLLGEGAIMAREELRDRCEPFRRARGTDSDGKTLLSRCETPDLDEQRWVEIRPEAPEDAFSGST